MTSTDNLSLYDAREHTTSKFQKTKRLRLRDNHTNNVVARVRAQVINEEFNAWVQEFDPQDLIISYAHSDSEEDDVDKYSRGTPTFSQSGPKVNDCLDKTELYKTRPKGMIRTSVRHVPQV